MIKIVPLDLENHNKRNRICNEHSVIEILANVREILLVVAKLSNRVGKETNKVGFD